MAEGTLDANGELDPHSAAIITCVGKKGSGKTTMALLYAQSWPFDMVVLDVAGDDGPMPRPARSASHDVHDLAGTVDDLPRRWPEQLRLDGRPMILRYVPDPGSATELEDMDAVVGLALSHSRKDKPVMLVVHEIGRAAPAGKTRAHMRRVVNHSRHHGLTCVFCGPRTLTVEPLVISQADLVYVFDLPGPADRRRVAENIGWNPAALDAAVAELGQYEPLLFDARRAKPEHPDDDDYRLVHLEAIPADEVADILRWARGEPARP